MSKLLQLTRRIFTVRNLLRTVFVLIAMITAWTALCMEERWRGERLWNEYRAKATTRGVTLDLKDAISPEIPDAENFAAIPMIRELFAAKEQGRPDPKWFEAAKVDEIKSTLSQGAPGQSLLDKWSSGFVTSGVVPAKVGDSADTVLAALKLIEPELAQLREAGQRPSSRFPVQWEKGISASLPHLTPLLQTVKIYRLSMAAHLAKGDSESAKRDVRDGLRIYSALKSEPALICGLVRLSALRIMDEGVVADGALSKWSNDDLRELKGALADVDLEKDLEFSLQSERALMNLVFDDLMTKSNTELAALGKAIGTDQSLPPFSIYPRGWFRLSQVKTNQHFDQMLGKQWPMKTTGPKDPILEPGTSTLARMPYVLYVICAPAFEGFLKTYAFNRTFLDQVQIACALDLFRREHGEYPDKLDALQPAFLSTVPQDPMDGLPMRYRRTNDGGFELWSVGLNRIDDGAKQEPGKSEREQPDWVLKIPGKP